jgi:hypothetical protein
MLRRSVLALVLVISTLGAVSAPAQAGGWDYINDRSGYGHVLLRAWTRNYAQVAFVADHAGTRIAVSVRVDCRDGYHFEDSWSDGGRRFRFILGGLRDNGRCNHSFRVDGNDPNDRLDLAIYAR